MTSPLSETLLRQPTTSDAADAAVCLPPTSRCVVAEESAKRATAVKKRHITPFHHIPSQSESTGGRGALAKEIYKRQDQPYLSPEPVSRVW